jgi:predicted metal-dependent hydrolase
MRDNSFTRDFDGVGSVQFERSHKAKHLNITVKPFSGVRVAVPEGLSFEKAERIVLSKIEWVKKHQKNMSQIEQKHKNILKNSKEINSAEAKEILITRLNDLTDKTGFNYEKVFVRNQKARWGSCSDKNNISLNIKLVKLPDELIDYVILHELVHTKIKSHSNAFWAELDKHVSDAKGLHRRLKNFGDGIL